MFRAKEKERGQRRGDIGMQEKRYYNSMQVYEKKHNEHTEACMKRSVYKKQNQDK